METISIAFDGKATPLVSFNNEVDPITATRHLRLHAESPLDQFVKHLQLEP